MMGSGESGAGPVERVSTGVPGLDEHLQGGLLPGTLTVVVGSTGIGKTQWGIQFADAGRQQEGRRGVIFDLATRGDSQHHREYAQRLCQWSPEAMDPEEDLSREEIFDLSQEVGEYLHIFRQSGRRVTRSQVDSDLWRAWQEELSQRLGRTIAFFYSHFIRGVRRVVIDGVEPVDRPDDSIQFELFEYVYHQVLRKEHDWVARDLLRQHFRSCSDRVAQNAYEAGSTSCLFLYTCHEATLDAMIERPLDQGDLLVNANTVIYLGKIREGHRFRRALYVAKHRGSNCPDAILPYEITDSGIRLEA